ncbi:DUF342 domain-containing protein [Paenibacillus sp. y28]|uniref:DUF342 domain-containing protein n=1 Tax=Paenibacillus sp. y28 TaxID=3129110 RepID=UPI003015EEE5
MSDSSMPLDLCVTVSLSEHKLQAYMQFSNVPEDFTCTVGQLEELLNKNQVLYGIDYDMLFKLTQNPLQFVAQPAIVAQGDEPAPGDDGYIQFLNDTSTEVKGPVELDDGTVDYKQVTRLDNVRKGQPIAERIAPKEGRPGRTVTGEAVPALLGKEARFKLGKNVVTDPEQNFVYSTIDGLIVKTERNKINVFPVYEVNGDVDYRVGNIDFTGTVVIRGNVLTGFKVKADGDIRVIGGVEGAELEAGGSIEISAGILGHHKGLVKAGKDIKISFIQEGNVEAQGDIVVMQSIMHSQIRAGQSVICQGPKGLIVGGSVQAGERVKARTIGNTMSTPTTIEVGVSPELRNELSEMRGQLRPLAENLDKTEKALVILDQMAALGQLNPDRLAMRIKLSHTKKQTADEISLIKNRILEIERTLEDTERAAVEAMSVVYGGTKIVIGRYTRFVNDPVSRVTFKFMDGDIAMSSN